MAGKVAYLNKLRSLHPELSDELLELAWHLQDVEKAQQYDAILNTCTSYSEIVERVLHPMYVLGEVDELKAKKEAFLDLLVSFACLEKPGNGHAAVHHVKQMLDDPKVKKERQQFEENCKKRRWLSQSRYPDQLVVQLQVVVRGETSVTALLDFLLTHGGTVVQAEAQPGGSSLWDEMGHELSHPENLSNGYWVTCPWAAVPGLLQLLAHDGSEEKQD